MKNFNLQISGATIGALALLAAASFFFYYFPQVDLFAAHGLYLGNGKFLLSDNALSHIIDGPVDKVLKFGFLIAFMGYLALCAMRAKFLQDWHPRLIFVFASVFISELIIINWLLKNHWGRARPHQLIEFGGTAHFTPAWERVHECLTNCSFTSGHAGMAACVGLLAVFLPPRWRGTYLVFAVAFTALAGFVRMAHGAHFLSDVTLSALIVLATAMVVKDALHLRL